MLTDAQWVKLEPLIEVCRPKGKTPPQDLRRTIAAILWRHQNGAKWRSIPAELGPWSRALRPSSAGRVWACGSIFLGWPRSTVCSSGWRFSTAPASGRIRRRRVPLERGLSR